MNTLTEEEKKQAHHRALVKLAQDNRVDWNIHYLYSAHVLSRGDHLPFDFLNTYARTLDSIDDLGEPGSRNKEAAKNVLMRAESVQDLVILKSLGFDFESVDDHLFNFWLVFAYVISKSEALWWWFSENTEISWSSFTAPATRLAIEYGDTRMFDIILLDGAEHFQKWSWEHEILKWAVQDSDQLRGEELAKYWRAQYCLAKIVHRYGFELELDIRKDWDVYRDEVSAQNKLAFYNGVLDIMTKRNVQHEHQAKGEEELGGSFEH